MSRFFTYLHRGTLSKAVYLFVAICYFPNAMHAQLIVSANRTATALASALVGSGVTILSPTLTCPGNANATFTTGVVSPLGIPNGIVLTSGNANDTLGGNGVANPSSVFANKDNGAGGDADLTALAHNPTLDACVLEFDFKAAGDTVSFKYVFGSEEYTSFACTSFNDAFGFFISGGTYVTPTNLALVPGTSIPVCINSVNCGPTGSGVLSTCTSMGPGSPFCAYYVNNTVSTAPGYNYVVYDGLTTVLTATALVSPCDTYHLKLGVADASDRALDSGVFIEGGSLSSNPPATITALGTSGLPYCIRGCAPGNFVFNIPTARDTNTTVRYVISGTAVNGYDYTTIADSVVILAHTTTSILDIDPLLVPAAGPRVVTLGILVHDFCHGTDSVGATASLTILDSFGFHIVTPDTLICQGEHVDIVAVGDTLFGGILHYRWTPGATLSDDTLLTPTATPFVTTTYTLSDSTAPALGCAVESRSITITVYNRPTLTTDSPYVKTCVGVPVQLHVYAGPGGIPHSYLWTPATDLSGTTVFDPTVNPSAPGDITYTVTVSPTALLTCSSTDTIHVHTLPNDFILQNPDTAICIGQSVQVRITGSNEFAWSWAPPTGVSSTTIKQPIITPTLTTTYTVTAKYAHCPDMVHSFNIEVDYPAPTAVYTDTLCLGQSATYDFTSDIPGYYHYQWTPATYVSDDTIPNPVFAPTVWGSYSWTVSIQPNAAGCTSFGVVNLLVTPNSISIKPNDTAVCRGKSIQVTGASYPLFTYQWLPTAGVTISDIIDPLITPDTSELYVVTARFEKCPDMHDTLRVDVQPQPTVFAGGNRFVCTYDTIHVHGSVSPAWYTHYTYSWTPATNLDVTDASTVVFTGGDTSTLVLTVTTPAGCIDVDSAHITVFPGDFAQLDPPVKDFCPHDSMVLRPTGGASYSWTPSLYLSDSMGAAPVIKPITSQTYRIVVTSIYGCKDTLHFEAIVHAGAVLSLGDDTIVLHPGETAQLDPKTNCTRFTWYPPAGLNDWMISNPIASPEISTKYIVRGYTENGCKASDSVDIIVDPESILAVPNAFTPGSGVNGEFKIIKKGIATLNYFRIFNRWGNMVFETSNIDKGWNGEFNGTPQPFGVFVYDIEAVTSTGKIFRKHGNLTLIR